MTELTTNHPRRIGFVGLAVLALALTLLAVVYNIADPTFGFGFAMGVGFLGALLLLMDVTNFTGLGK